MPWNEVTTLTLRYEFVTFALQEGSNISQLCIRFGISRKTGYKWLRYFLESGERGLGNHSSRPHHSPYKTAPSMEEQILALREKHPSWGGRKLKVTLQNGGQIDVPAASTITSILRRNGRIHPEESVKHKAFIRFEHPCPNWLWQMDFKGHFPTNCGRCHPLTILDDHSRFNLLLRACADEKTDTVKQALISTFRCYGLPYRMTMDNGSPWGGDSPEDLTALTVWLIRIGVCVSHSRPYHPQTQGKDERFHRTLNEDAIRGFVFRDLEHCQSRFDDFRHIYNFERPHESLKMKPPCHRYQPSQRQYLETLPPIEYGTDDIVRMVQDKGKFSFKGRDFRVSAALRGQPIALRPTSCDGIYSVRFCHHALTEISLH